MPTKKQKKVQATPDSYPFDSGNHRIDRSFVQPYKYRVYYWCERPDAANYGPDDQFHWHPDTEHDSFEAAFARLQELEGGGEPKSLYRGPVTTRH
jgi:hypothetical protein